MWTRFHGQRLYLDTNIFIYAIEKGNRWTELLRTLFEAIDRGQIRAVTSELTIAEVLTKPYAVGAEDLIQRYQVVLSGEGALHVVPVDRSVLDFAAQVRAQTHVKLMDAIHIATASDRICDAFLSNDTRLGGGDAERTPVRLLVRCFAAMMKLPQP